MKTNESRQTVELTGDRDGANYGLLIEGKPVDLSDALFATFLVLVRAKLSSGDEFVRLSPTHICRIRQAVGKVIGKEEGYRMIADGKGTTYALARDKRGITVDAGFHTCPLWGASLKSLRAAILYLADGSSKGRSSKARRAKKHPPKSQSEAGKDRGERRGKHPGKQTGRKRREQPGVQREKDGGEDGGTHQRK